LQVQVQVQLNYRSEVSNLNVSTPESGNCRQRQRMELVGQLGTLPFLQSKRENSKLFACEAVTEGCRAQEKGSSS